MCAKYEDGAHKLRKGTRAGAPIRDGGKQECEVKGSYAAKMRGNTSTINPLRVALAKSKRPPQKHKCYRGDRLCMKEENSNVTKQNSIHS